MTPPSLLFAFMTWVRHLKPDKTYIKMYFKNLVVKRTLWYNFKMYFFFPQVVEDDCKQRILAILVLRLFNLSSVQHPERAYLECLVQQHNF